MGLSIEEKSRELLFHDLESFIKIGIEKEGLRVGPCGKLSNFKHPGALGSKLTHSYITTDYGEALLELITPPLQTMEETLEFLHEVHREVYSKMNRKEIIWPASMPAILPDDKDIAIAHFGSSHLGKLKSLYRQGLAYRYGRRMQMIGGVHFNFSLSRSFWQKLHRNGQEKGDLQDFINRSYFHLIRNFKRYSWLLNYLFGASPFVDKSFLKESNFLSQMGKDTYGYPYATGLRMGDIGYTSSAQREINPTYNDLENYISVLEQARKTPHKEYQDIGTKDEKGEYKQLNTSVIQIDNEFYGDIRPKSTILPGESSIQALHKRGVEYIEVRSLDLNPFSPIGITGEEIHFLELFLLVCLLSPSEMLVENELQEIKENFRMISQNGAAPGLKLMKQGKMLTIEQMTQDLFEDMSIIAQFLDQQNLDNKFHNALAVQKKKCSNPHLLPSSKLREMVSSDLSYVEAVVQLGENYRNDYQTESFGFSRRLFWNEAAISSLQHEQDLEESDMGTFESFLEKYFSNIQIL